MKVRCLVGKADAIRRGQEPPEGYVYVNIDVATLTQSQRDTLAGLGQSGERDGTTLSIGAGDPVTEVGAELDRLAVQKNEAQRARAERVERLIQSWLAMSQGQLNEACIGNWSEEQEAAADPRVADRLALRADYRARKEREEAERRACGEAESKRSWAVLEAEREQRDAERAVWAAQHGSSRLQKALTAGYECQRLYVEERAALEFPGFEVDFSGNARWKERVGPSEQALDIEAELKTRGLDASIVWLTELPLLTDEPTGEYFDFTPREAVIVSGFLGRYDLIKLM